MHARPGPWPQAGCLGGAQPHTSRISRACRVGGAAHLASASRSRGGPPCACPPRARRCQSPPAHTHPIRHAALGAATKRQSIALLLCTARGGGQWAPPPLAPRTLMGLMPDPVANSSTVSTADAGMRSTGKPPPCAHTHPHRHPGARSALFSARPSALSPCVRVPRRSHERTREAPFCAVQRSAPAEPCRGVTRH